MPREAYAHHVEDFALLKVGAAINPIQRGHFALALGLGRSDSQFDQGSWRLGAVEVIGDFDAIFVVDALEAGQIVIFDGVSISEIEGDVDQLFGWDQEARLDDRDGPPAELLVDAVRERSLLVGPEPDEAWPSLGALGFLCDFGRRGRGGFRLGR